MQTYQSWKLEPFTVNQDKDRLAFEIASLISDLTKFYGLIGLQPEETEAILNFIFQYFKNFQRFKVCDMIRAVELYKKRPDLNKLCPEYFETMFDLYRKSAERKEILRLFEVDEERKLPEKSAPTKEKRLSECKAHFKNYGKIDYWDGKVYLDNFDQIKEILGEEVLNELKQQAKENLITECQNNILKKIDVTESKNILDQFESGEYFALWKVETRKLHLAEWFKNMEMAEL